MILTLLRLDVGREKWPVDQHQSKLYPQKTEPRTLCSLGAFRLLFGPVAVVETIQQRRTQIVFSNGGDFFSWHPLQPHLKRGSAK